MRSLLPNQELFSGYRYGKSVSKIVASGNYIDYPRVVSIETMVACNAKCSFCAYPDSERKGDKMDTDLFYKIIDDLNSDGRYPMSITLARINEPLLGKRLKEFSLHIRKVFPKSIYSIWSNGLKLNQEDIAWINELGGNANLQVSLNTIDAAEHRLSVTFRKDVAGRRLFRPPAERVTPPWLLWHLAVH
jgi:MoaA/NifB/PqqE/SkfB family radical SAM enzyme